MTSDWMGNSQAYSGPEYLRGIERYPNLGDDHDFNGEDALVDPVLEAVGRLVNACAYLEIALFQALTVLDRRYDFPAAEACGPKGCVRRLRSIASQLTPVRPSQARKSTSLENLLDDASEHLKLRNGVVHGRSGRKFDSDVYESSRWVREKGQEPRLVTTVFDRNRLMLVSVRATNVAADILDCLEEWSLQKDRIRRDQRLALGDGHPTRAQDRVLHALADDRDLTLCGLNATRMDRYLMPAASGESAGERLFEDSNPAHHCKECSVASGFAAIT